MSYKIRWSNLALSSHVEEIDYIFFKWNIKEVLKFEQPTIIELHRLSKNTEIGSFDKKSKLLF